MKKIAIVVDNPMRDLYGNSLLAYQIAKKGYEVYLLPMYEQEFHIRRLKPDMVIVNYARTANANKIRAYHKAGIKVAVLDTEGGVFRCEYRDLVDIVIKSGVMNYIDYYFLWGRRQTEAFKQVVHNNITQFILTGSPRYDFVDPRWERAVQKPDDFDSYVLCLMSFPIINPAFSSSKKELEMLEKNTVDTSDQIKKMEESLRKAFDGSIEIIKELARKYPDTVFVVRPHPFECPDIYIREFSDSANIYVRQEGNVSNWIKYSLFVLQLNSSTGIEAGFYNKKSISMEMFQNEEIMVPAVVESSLRAKTHDELYELFDILINKKEDSRFNELIKKTSQSLNQIIDEWYYKIDGNAAERLSNAVENVFKSEERKPIFFNPFNKRFFYIWSRYFTQRIFDDMFRKKIVTTRKTKEFSADQVKSIIENFGDDVCIEPITLFGKVPFYKTLSVRVTSA